MLAWPNHRDTFRISFVLWRMFKAHECLKEWGDTFFVERLGQRCAAISICLSRMYSKPERLMVWPRALKNSSGTELVPLIANQARIAAAVSFHRGWQRCLRPFPWI